MGGALPSGHLMAARPPLLVGSMGCRWGSLGGKEVGHGAAGGGAGVREAEAELGANPSPDHL